MGDSEWPRDVDTADRLENIRGREYGNDAWKITGELLEILPLDRIRADGYLSPVASILRKLVRAANDPSKSEHWADMEVYVRLIRRDTEAREQSPRDPVGTGT